MDSLDRLNGPLLRVGLWLPAGTLVAFAGLAAVGAVRFPNAVLAVTLLAALGWVAVGVGGDRAEGPLAPGREASTGGLPVAARLLIYLSVTTVLGWAVVLLVFP